MNKEIISLKGDLMSVPTRTSAPVSAYPAEYVPEPQAGSVLDYAAMVGRRKWLVGGCAVTGLLIGIGITLPQSPLYKARTTLEIQDGKENVQAAKLLNPVPDTSPTDIAT